MVRSHGSSLGTHKNIQQAKDYSEMEDEFINVLLTNALRSLNEAQRISLVERLIERLPKEWKEEFIKKELIKNTIEKQKEILAIKNRPFENIEITI